VEFPINKKWLMTGDDKLLFDLPESNRAAISAGRCSSYANKKSGGKNERVSERGRKSRICDEESVRHITKPPKVLQSLVPKLYRSRSLLSRRLAYNNAACAKTKK